MPGEIKKETRRNYNSAQRCSPCVRGGASVYVCPVFGRVKIVCELVISSMSLAGMGERIVEKKKFMEYYMSMATCQKY